MTKIEQACRTFRCTPSHLNRLVRSGAVHPFVLVEDLLRQRMAGFIFDHESFSGLSDYATRPFPWGRKDSLGPLVVDAVAAATQDSLWHVLGRDAYYYAAYRVADVVFESSPRAPGTATSNGVHTCACARWTRPVDRNMRRANLGLEDLLHARGCDGNGGHQ